MKLLILVLAMIATACMQTTSHLQSDSAIPYGSHHSPACTALGLQTAGFPDVSDVDGFVDEFGIAAYVDLNSLARIEAAQANLLANITTVETWTGKTGKTAGWEKLLKWNEIRQIVAAGPDGNIERLREIESSFHQGSVVSLQLTKINALGDSVSNYIDALAFHASPLAENAYLKAIEDIRVNLKGALRGEHGAARRLGVLTAWIKSSGQATTLANAIFCYFSYSNIQASLSERLMGMKINQNIYTNGPVQDHIDGASVRGTGITNATFRVDVVPSENEAKFFLRAEGTTSSDVKSWTNHAAVYSRSSGSFKAQKEIRLGRLGFTPLVATATSRNQTQIKSFEEDFWLYREERLKKLHERMRNASQAGADRLVYRSKKELEKRAAEPLAKMQKDYKGKFVSRMVARDLFPERLTYRSDEDHIYMNMFQASRSQLGPSTAAPKAFNGDATARLHESALNNLFEKQYGATIFSDEDAERIAADFTGDVPDDLAVDPIEAGWNTLLLADIPISVSFRNDEVRYVIEGENFNVDDEQVSGRYTLFAKAKFVKANGVYKKQLLPDSTVLKFYDGESVDAETQELMQRKLAGLLGLEIFRATVPLEEGFNAKGTLRLEFAESQEGWLNLGWRTQQE